MATPLVTVFFHYNVMRLVTVVLHDHFQLNVFNRKTSFHKSREVPQQTKGKAEKV